MSMGQAGVLIAIPAAAFVLVALFHKLLPRRGDWIVVLALGAVFVLGLLVVHDFQRYWEHGEFMPNGANRFAFDWINIGDGLLKIE